MGTQETVAVEIDAPHEDVWAAVARPELWPRWTRSMKSVELLDGGLAIGARVRIAQPGMPPVVWTVTDLRPGSAFTWTAGAPGVRTEASHTVEPLDGRSRLTLVLRQRGPLAGVVRLLLAGRTRGYMNLEAQGLKRAAEEGHRP